MKLCDLFGQGRTVFSCEVFPPKKTAPVDSIYRTLDGLKDIRPDFISVTFGAGGSQGDKTTRDIAVLIQDQYHIPAMAAHIRARGGFGVSAACYPEGHLESPDLVSDIRHLKEKVDAGAQHLVSQLFFDNEDFFRFLERARIAGIEVPIEAGIMPVLSKSSIQRMVSMCGASLPARLTRILARYGDHPEALREAGIAYAIDQISDLIAGGVDGIHLYTMNDPEVAKQIAGSIASIRTV